jgi:4-hydroxybenzoyl-CoA reductase subunit beta
MKTETLNNSQSKYLLPISVEEAVQLAIDYNGKAKFIAGGTDLMVNRFQGNDLSQFLIDLSRIPELRDISISDGILKIGAMSTLESLATNELINKHFPILVEAVNVVGSPLIRASATIVGNILCENRCSFYNQTEFWRTAVGFCLKCEGNICIATGGSKACFSKYISDTAPALLALDAQLEIVGEDGLSTIPLNDIFTGNGVQPINLPGTSIIQNIQLPVNKTFRTYYRKLRHRESLDFTSLTVAVSLDDNEELRIALSGIDPKPVFIHVNQSVDPDLLIQTAYKKSRAIDNDYYPRTYRKKMLKVFLHQAFVQLGIESAV